MNCPWSSLITLHDELQASSTTYQTFLYATFTSLLITKTKANHIGLAWQSHLNATAFATSSSGGGGAGGGGGGGGSINTPRRAEMNARKALKKHSLSQMCVEMEGDLLKEMDGFLTAMESLLDKTRGALRTARAKVRSGGSS